LVKLRSRIFDPLFLGLLAEREANAQNIDAALATIDDSLTRASEMEERYTDAYLHLIRGDILLKRNPADSAPGENAYQTAVAIAKEQGARSYELLASLALAKLYQSSERPAQAHAVLAPALHGFSATPEMPQIAEAQALLAALAETDEVKNAAAARQRRLQLQTRYARAMMWTKGLGSDEAKVAFEGARSLGEGTGDIDERFATLYGLWITSLARGELRMSQEAAETFRRDAQDRGRLTEAGVAHRFLGLTSWMRGDFTTAKAHLEEALRLYDPERDREAKFRFGLDTHFAATVYLASVTLALGDIERARKLIEESVARAVESGRVPDLINAYHYKTSNEVVLGDAEAALRAAEIHREICKKHQVVPWSSLALQSAWARARLGDRKIGIADLRRALAASLEENEKVHIPPYQARLAELEAEEGDFEGALARIDEALALARETGAHAGDAFLYRLRGEILLKRDPGNPAPAEEPFQTALAIAEQQGGRLYGLRAALSLAKLYQSTARPAEAHAILAPAFEGFSPTPEMPQIGEARALLEQLGGGDRLGSARKRSLAEGVGCADIVL
jgi:predicted ATPase